MRNILVLTSTFPLDKESPINPCVKNLILALSKKIKITVLLPDHPKLETSYLKNRNIEFIRFKYFWPRSWQKLAYGSGIIPNLKSNPLLALEIFPFLLSQIKTTREILRSKKIDIVLANWAMPSGLSGAISISKRNKTKLITYVHGSDAYIKNLIYRKFFYYTIKKSSHVVTVSESLLGEISRMYKPKKISIIPQGVKFCKLRYCKRKPQIVFAGRLIPGKGAKNLIDGFFLLKNKYPGYKLLIIGQGLQGESLKKYVAKNKIPNIEFLGSLPNSRLIEKLQQSKLLVFPSTLNEGLPNILLEAAANKLPILSNDTGGVRDLLSEKVAYFTEPSPQKISEKIDMILSDYPRAIQKSNTLYNRIRRDFSVSKSANNLLEIFKSL
jgi:glycosyltransferase involved in cell wall biosynthesis